MNCNVCGHLVMDSDTFCYSCGKPLTVSEMQTVGGFEDVPGVVPWRAGEVAVGIFVILAYGSLVSGIWHLTENWVRRYPDAIATWGFSHLVGLAILVVVWRLGLHPRRLSLSSLGFVRPITTRLTTGGLAVLVLAASLLFAGLYSLLMRHLGWSALMPPVYPPEIVFPGLGALATIEALVVWTPIMEEIFFRRFVFAGLTPRLGIPRAIVVSALVFSAFHIVPGVLVPTFVTGMLLAWLYHRTGSLWPGIVAHAGQNALAVSALILGG